MGARSSRRLRVPASAAVRVQMTSEQGPGGSDHARTSPACGPVPAGSFPAHLAGLPQAARLASTAQAEVRGCR
jgi:hypothetical protein